MNQMFFTGLSITIPLTGRKNPPRGNGSVRMTIQKTFISMHWSGNLIPFDGISMTSFFIQLPREFPIHHTTLYWTRRSGGVGPEILIQPRSFPSTMILITFGFIKRGDISKKGFLLIKKQAVWTIRKISLSAPVFNLFNQIKRAGVTFFHKLLIQ